MYVAATGSTRLTSSADVPEPLEPTWSVPLKTHMSMSLPALTSASNSANRAYVVPAGTETSTFWAFGELNEHVESVGSSSTVPGVRVGRTSPRGVALNGPV